jgi:hypothetical protein
MRSGAKFFFQNKKYRTGGAIRPGGLFSWVKLVDSFKTNNFFSKTVFAKLHTRLKSRIFVFYSWEESTFLTGFTGTVSTGKVLQSMF